ncbi:fasciclin domain-containing protein [Sphingomicrobium sediminis]|uniref:Fasciclin domain-containing protein n=1 Tax=Sphingomicrobium sediminis TaxID=2950949 RepID=A0A9X2EH83_9SPHN|nr:fasciclin domain-containing protein [Sphingomicrobium sediminis]MCM8557421.1 fasciclin domain-containing protein [Sphingomicrobium sediminis]
MKFTKTLLAAAALATATAVPASAGHHHNSQPDIVAAAASNDNFETLVAAVKAAGLVETLQGDGPFTVFAPTDRAFAKLPDGTVGALVQPENRDALTGILTYHVVAGEFKAADVLDLVRRHGGSAAIPTVQGGELIASLSDGELILTDEQGNRIAVTQTDLDVSNGVIHVIDGVLMP